MPVRVALDVQALQPGSGASAEVVSQVAAWAGALARGGRLAAALLAPELPAPDDLPGGVDPALVDWDGAGLARRLAHLAGEVGSGGAGGAGLGPAPAPAGLVHLVPAVWLHTGPGAGGGMVATRHWPAAGVGEVAVVSGPPPPGALADLVEARRRWLASLDLVVMLTEVAAGGEAPPALPLAGGVQPGGGKQVLEVGGPPGDPGGWDDLVARLLATLDGPSAPEVDPRPRPGSPSPGGDPRSRLGSPSSGGDPRSRLGSPSSGGDRRPRPGPRPRPLPPAVAVFGPLPPAGGGIGAFNARFVAATRDLGLRVDTVVPAGQGVAGSARLAPDAFGTDVRPSSYDAVVYTLGNSDGHLATVEAALRHPGWLWLHEGRLPAVFTTALAEADDGEYLRRMGRLLEAAYPGRAPLAALRRAGRDHIVLAGAGVGLTGVLACRQRGVIVNSEAARRVLLADLAPGAWVPPLGVVGLPCPPVRPGAPAPPRPGGRQVVTFGVVASGKRPEVLVDAAALGGFDLAFVGPCPAVLRQLIEERAAARGCSGRVRVTGEVAEDEWWAWMGQADVAVQLRDSTTGESSAAVTDALSAGRPVVTNLVSGLPPGTVELLADASAPAVAAAVTRLLADPERRWQLSRAAAGYARGYQFADAANALWELVLGTDVLGSLRR